MSLASTIGSTIKTVAIPAAALGATYLLSSSKPHLKDYNGYKIGSSFFTAAAAFGINRAAELALKGRFGLPVMSNKLKLITFVAQLAGLFFIKDVSSRRHAQNRGSYETSYQRSEAGRQLVSYAQAAAQGDRGLSHVDEGNMDN